MSQQQDINDSFSVTNKFQLQQHLYTGAHLSGSGGAPSRLSSQFMSPEQAGQQQQQQLTYTLSST
jgi:hypothetical protein